MSRNGLIRPNASINKGRCARDVLMGGYGKIAKNVAEVRFANTVVENANAKSVVAVRFALMVVRNTFAKNAVVVRYVPMIDVKTSAKTVVVIRFAPMIDERTSAKIATTLYAISAMSKFVQTITSKDI
jgi:hypothetical protein